MINKGDILLIESYLDPIAWIISLYTKSKWTHVAWVLDNKYLLDSRSSGVKKSPIRKYVNKKRYKVKLVRIKGLTKDKIKLAMKYGKGLYCKENYFQFLLTLISIAFNYTRRTPIITCSGFIASCLSQVSFYFKKNKNPLLITPAEIANSKGVKNVSYEFSHFASCLQ